MFMRAQGCGRTRTIPAFSLTPGLSLTHPDDPPQVAGILRGDVRLIGESLDRDVIIEPARGPLIPGMMAVKEAAKAAGKSGRRIRHRCRE